MKKTLIALVIMVAGLGLSGCGPTLYRVNVNGYTDPAASTQLAPGGSFFVIENQQAPNPLLEKEIAGKINQLLTGKGYALVPYDQAQYYLFFSYGIGEERAANVAMPDNYTSYGFGLGGGSGWRGSPFVFAAPFFSFYPGPERHYDRWLLLNVVDGKYYREKGPVPDRLGGRGPQHRRFPRYPAGRQLLAAGRLPAVRPEHRQGGGPGDQRRRPPGAGVDQVSSEFRVFSF